MPRHYYSLLHTARELRPLLRGRRITEIFTQEKNSVIFFCENEHDTAILEVILDLHKGGIFRRAQYHRAGKNTADVLSQAIGSVIADVKIVPGQRVVQLFTVEENIINIVLFGRGHGGIVYTDSRRSRLIDTFKSDDDEDLLPLLAPTHQRTEEEILDTTTLIHYAGAGRWLLGSVYARVLAKKLNIPPKAHFSTWANRLQEVQDEAFRLQEELLNTRTFYIVQPPDALPSLWLCSPPVQDDATQIELFDSIINATSQWLSLRRKYEHFNVVYASVLQALTKKIDKTERALAHILDDAVSKERQEMRRLFAELLLSKEDLRRKGREKVTLEDWEGNLVEIPLKPELNTRENADLYYAMVKQANIAAKHRERRLEQQMQLLEALQTLQKQLSTIENVRSLTLWIQEHGKEIGMKTLPTEKKGNQPAAPTFREFDLGEGYTLFVGKSAAENDTLTMRFAKPNDIWLHARGVAGSHAVLKGAPPDKKPPKYILEAAAAIAAYYSKARNAGFTPVAYTRKKYVRKPKKAAVGAVVIEKEEVVMVKPGLPEGEEE